MGPCFRLFTGALRSNEKLITSIQVPDTVSLMPMNYESPSIANAPVLDALLQQCCLHAENIGNVSGEICTQHMSKTLACLSISLESW